LSAARIAFSEAATVDVNQQLAAVNVEEYLLVETEHLHGQQTTENKGC
jgi:hypothetical protein